MVKSGDSAEILILQKRAKTSYIRGGKRGIQLHTGIEKGNSDISGGGKEKFRYSRGDERES